MWEATLLVLDRINVARVRSEKVILKVRKELFYLKYKDSAKEIWTVDSLLSA